METQRTGPHADVRGRLQETLGGGYSLERELGGGGMSRVFLARDARLGRRVVIKVLHPDLAAGLSAARFEREVALAARLQHPHVVPLLSAGEVDGLPYYTMPFVEGESLRERLRREGALPVGEAVRLARELADALAYAHAQGVVHRDLKPENVLLSGGHAVVADFGVAKALATATEGSARTGGSAATTGVTGLGVAVGTPAYMAPEQAAADPATDHRADLYALGVVVYEALAGVHPFAGRAPQAMLAAHLTEAPPPLRGRRPEVPPALSTLVTRLLAKRPEDRPVSADAVVRAFDGVLAAVTPSGGAPTAGGTIVGPAPRWTRGGRRRAMIIGAAVVVLGLGAGAWWWTSAGAVAGGRHARPATAGTGRRMLAVLPFENLGDSADAYFADGVADEVRGKLASLAQLRVIASASTRQYRGTTKPPRQIARELGVRYLLTGRVRWDKHQRGVARVRVEPELVDVGEGPAGSDAGAAPVTAWQQPFDAALEDVFRVQSEIAGRVAAALAVTLDTTERRALAAAPTVSLDAYDAYLRGRAAFAEAGFTVPAVQRALAFQAAAVERDPRFALAWAERGWMHLAAYQLGLAQAAHADSARAAAEGALALAPGLPEAEIVLARHLWLVRDDRAAARGRLETLLARAPSNVEALETLAQIEVRLGLGDASDAHLREAIRLDPRRARLWTLLGSNALAYRRHDAARAALDRALALQPANVQARLTRATVEVAAGDTAAARAVLRATPPGTDRAPLVALAAAGPLWWLLDAEDQRLVLSLGPEAWGRGAAQRAIARAALFGWRGDVARQRAYGDSAAQAYAELRRARMAHPLPGAPTYIYPIERGVALAYAGRRSDALAEMERGRALVSRFEDPLDAAGDRELAARAFARIGARERALDVLEVLLRTSGRFTPAWVRLDPDFAPLRGDQRFEALIAGASGK